jgi:predicted  nucleic acid-binding Zn-ribbon protein
MFRSREGEEENHVKEQLQSLEELQAIDLRIRELQKSRDAIPQRIAGLLQDTRAREAELKVLEDRITELEREKRMLESNAQDYQAKLQKLQAVQAEVKNQKEYEAMLREVDGIRKHKSHFEEEVLRSMELLEELGKGRETAAQALEQSRKAVEGEVAALEAEMAAFDARIAEEGNQRSAISRAIPPELLKRYDTIRARRLGLAVVRVQGGVCAGCNMNLPPQLYNVVMRVATIEQCPSCNRILVYRAPEAQATAG